jgi:hypothetical protein
MAAALPNSGALHDTLTSGLSQKSAGSGAIVTNTPVAAGQVLYTLQVVPTSTSPGTVFDGSLPGIRAAVRDNVGNELLSQADFALGRLELQ